MSAAKRTPGDVLRQARKDDSLAKRARVLSVLDAMVAQKVAVTFAEVARRAQVSTWLVYAEGVREHVERARKGQETAARRGRAAGSGASSASLATDLALAREQIRKLREERDRLRKAAQRHLGAQLEASGTAELRERCNELQAALDRVSGERDETRAAVAAAQEKLAETQDELAALRASTKKLMKLANRPGGAGGA